MLTSLKFFFFLMSYFLTPREGEGEAEIQTRDLRFIRRSPQPIELSLKDFEVFDSKKTTNPWNIKKIK